MSQHPKANATAQLAAAITAYKGQKINEIAAVNLVGFWKMNGNANDSIGNKNGVLQNGTTFATGNVGQAFSFDGVDDRVDVPIGRADTIQSST